MSGLASRSLDEMLLAAAESGLSSEGREEQWEARRAEDDQVLETLRSAVLQHEPPEGGPPVASVDWARWSTADNRDSMHRQPLTTPREQPTWTAVFEDRPATVPGPLRGLEVGVKDLMHVDGHRVTAATRAHRSTPAAEAPAVSALRRAGADIVGTTNLHALAYGATGTSSDWGVPQNPAVPGAIPGGSSSGSAVAVAEGSAHVTVGTDTAGSIRIPAALCGVVGLKPTFGAVPVEGCHPLAPTLDHIGPLAGSVALVAEAFAAMAGQSPRESAPEDDAGQPVLGVLRGYFDTLLDPAVRAALAATLDRLQAAGFTLVDVDLPLAEHVPGAQLATMSMEALRSNLETLRERAYLLPPDVRLRLEAGLGRTPAQYEAAQQLRAAWQRQVDAALGSAHALVCPTVTILPPAVGTATVSVDGQNVTTQFAVTRLTMPFSLSGHPAITLPCSGPDEPPVGMQLVGPRHGDQDLLRLAQVVEVVTGSAA